MQHNIKKEKSDINILSANFGSRKTSLNKNVNPIRPDTLEIKVKPENIANLLNKADICNENGTSWTGESFDNFISHLKNANNTPSPITPNSFFNPSDVTQEQEQFADTLTMHLNKIKEDYKSSIESTDSSYLGNILQISSVNEDRPVQIATVSVGNKLFLLNQINPNIDETNGTCLNYGLIDLPGNISIHNDLNNVGSNTIILQKNNNNNATNHPQLKISNIQNLKTHVNVVNPQSLVFSTPNVQFSNYSNRDELSNILPVTGDINIPQTTDVVGSRDVQPVNFIKSSDGILYTRIPDSSQNQLLSQLNSLTNVVTRVSSANPINQISVKPITIPVDTNGQSVNDTRCLSVSSSANESNCGASNSSVGNATKDVSNISKSNIKDEKDIDEQMRRLERKRARNRDAARKCRDRKNNLILTLEQKYAKQTAEKELIREKLLKSLEEIRRLTDYIAKHDPHSKFSSFNNFLQEIKIHELTDTDLKDLNLL